MGWLCLWLFALLAVTVLSAPISEDEQQPQIFRVKRSDDSSATRDVPANPREKKAYDSMLNGGVNPEPILLPENEDKNGEVEVKTEVAKDMAQDSPDVNDELPNTDLSQNDDKELEALKETAVDQEPEEETEVEEEIEAPVAPVVPEIPENKAESVESVEKEERQEDPTEEEIKHLEEVPSGHMSLEEPQSEEAAEQYGSPFADGLTYEQLADYFYPSGNTVRNFQQEQYFDPEQGYPIQGENEDGGKHGSRGQRDITSKSMTAEDMVMGNADVVDKSNRQKRDLGLGLTPDEIRELISEDEPYGYYPEYEPQDSDGIQELINEAKRSYGDDLEEEEERYPYLDTPYREDEDNDEYAGLLDEYDSERNDDDYTRDRLMRYFQGLDGDESRLDDNGYYVNDDEELVRYPESNIQEQWSMVDDNSPDSLADYLAEAVGESPELIEHDGSLGYFIRLRPNESSKRSYMSFMPPAKRFYPADETPEATRWNALLAGPKERSDEQVMSDRLYRLARALNGQEDLDQYTDEMEYYKK